MRDKLYVVESFGEPAPDFPRALPFRMSRLLLALAAPKEALACIAALGGSRVALMPWTAVEARPGVDVLETGVGPAQAAGATARYLTLNPGARVVNLGIGGALPGTELRLLDVVLGRESVFADLGIETDQGFCDIGTLGFGAAPEQRRSAWSPDPGIAAALRPITPHFGGIATVSTCSGTDARAAATLARTGALAEAMEGAAIAAVCVRLSAPFVECRVISNTTGDRSRQRWALGEALARLGQVCADVARVLGPAT